MHYAGVACEMDTIIDIAKRHNIMVVEDAAQAVMSTYKGNKVFCRSSCNINKCCLNVQLLNGKFVNNHDAKMLDLLQICCALCDIINISKNILSRRDDKCQTNRISPRSLFQ